MSMKLGNKIAEGGCSEVFEWEDNSKLIKLAKANMNYDALEREFINNRIAWESGIPSAEPIELIEINGRPGIVYERIIGETMMERFMKQVLDSAFHPSLLRYEDIRTTARMLSEIHNKTNITLPSTQKENMKYMIKQTPYLSLYEREKIISHLDSLTTKYVLCHGDPNPGNLFIRENGDAVMIDWMDAAIGNPEGDVAEYIIMIRYADLSYLPDHIVKMIDSVREKIIDVFMEEYSKQTGMTYEDVVPWFVPIAARKLYADAISEAEKKVLVSEIRRLLK